MKYTDNTAAVQVLGCHYVKPDLFEREAEYKIKIEDFTENFHAIMYQTMYSLYHNQNVKEFNQSLIETYLEARPKQFAVYKANRGGEWLQKLAEVVQPQSLNYYYGRLKKMTLLRAYQEVGMDLSWLYDNDNILDLKKKQEQEETLDNMSLEDIANEIDTRITTIRMKYATDAASGFLEAGEDIEELVARLQAEPEIGYPLFGPLVNTVHRGARLKKFYLRSAATGTGKTRSMIADACYIGCDEMYDLATNKWIRTGATQPTMYIATEQDSDEIRTMMLAFLSGVNEEAILTGKYTNTDEIKRVKHAMELLEISQIYIRTMTDYTLDDIENAIKFGIHEYGVKYVFFDYIHSSLGILGEISAKAGVKGLREDNVLFMMSVRLKNICNDYGVFILSSTQLNGGYTEAQEYDQNLLRGAKAIADSIDVGMIMLKATEKDHEAMSMIYQKGFPKPDMKISVYKNRRGRWKDILLWCKADLGSCRITPIFVTDYSYRLIDMKDLKVDVV